MWIFIMLLTFGSVALASHILFSPAVNKIMTVSERRSQKLVGEMDRMFMRTRVSQTIFLFTFGPIIGGGGLFLISPPELKIVGLILGVAIGVVGPGIYVKFLGEKRKTKFEDQLIDALMILSSSLKGGLSLIQAIEVVVEEMPEPLNQEFGILLGENKMGVPLEDSFAHLYVRMPSVPLHQMITAILLARETGGNLPVIFSRIVQTIRENKKIKQNLDNMTLQGRIQGVVMALLPIGFAIIVTSTNPHFFDQMFKSDIGRALLIYALVSEIVGAFFIWKISRFKDF